MDARTACFLNLGDLSPRDRDRKYVCALPRTSCLAFMGIFRTEYPSRWDKGEVDIPSRADIFPLTLERPPSGAAAGRLLER